MVGEEGMAARDEADGEGMPAWRGYRMVSVAVCVASQHSRVCGREGWREVRYRSVERAADPRGYCLVFQASTSSQVSLVQPASDSHSTDGGACTSFGFVRYTKPDTL